MCNFYFIDAIGRQREQELIQEMMNEQTLNQILTNMDGFSRKGIIILGVDI